MKLGKLIGRAALGAFVLSIIPYKIVYDKEAKNLELRSLLWGVRKTPGEEKDNYTFAIPGSGLEPEEKTPAEENAQEDPA